MQCVDFCLERVVSRWKEITTLEYNERPCRVYTGASSHSERVQLSMRGCAVPPPPPCFHALGFAQTNVQALGRSIVYTGWGIASRGIKWDGKDPPLLVTSRSWHLYRDGALRVGQNRK